MVNMANNNPNLPPTNVVSTSEREEASSLQSAASIYGGSAENRFVELRQLRSVMVAEMAEFRRLYEALASTTMEEIEADDNRFGDAADVNAARRAVIIATMDWVNRCAELLDPVEDYATWESTALIVARFDNRLRSMPPRIPEDPAVHVPLNMPTKESVMAYVQKQLNKRRRPNDETVVSNAPPEKLSRRSRKSSATLPEDDTGIRRRLMPPPPPPGDRRPPSIVEIPPPLLPTAASAAATAAAAAGATAPVGSGSLGVAVKRKVAPVRAKSADYQRKYEERLRQVEEEDAEALRVEEQAKMWTERIRELEKEKEEKRRAIMLAEKKEKEEEEQRKLNMQQEKEKHDHQVHMKRFEERQKQIQRRREDANNAVIWCRNRFDALNVEENEEQMPTQVWISDSAGASEPLGGDNAGSDQRDWNLPPPPGKSPRRNRQKSPPLFGETPSQLRGNKHKQPLNSTGNSAQQTESLDELVAQICQRLDQVYVRQPPTLQPQQQGREVVPQRPTVCLEQEARIKQIAAQQARDARPATKFSRSQPMDYKNYILRFELAVNSPGMDSRAKMMELTHWFGSPALEIIDAYLVQEDADVAYATLRSELDNMFGTEGDSAIPLIRQLTTGNNIGEYDHDAHVALYTKLVQVESTAKAFGRMDQLNRRDTLIDIVENRLRHFVKEFWVRDAQVRAEFNRDISYEEFKAMLTKWIGILSSRRPHVPVKADRKDRVSTNATKVGQDQQAGQQQQQGKKAFVEAVKDSPTRQQPTDRCNVCQSFHRTDNCHQLTRAPMDKRSEKLKELRLCFHCLQPGHVSRNCPSPPGCTKCPGFHHTLFHGRPVQKKENPSSGANQGQPKGVNVNAQTFHPAGFPQLPPPSAAPGGPPSVLPPLGVAEQPETNPSGNPVL